MLNSGNFTGLLKIIKNVDNNFFKNIEEFVINEKMNNWTIICQKESGIFDSGSFSRFMKKKMII